VTYAYLTVTAATRARGLARLVPTLFSLGWLLTELTHMYKATFFKMTEILIPSTFAASPDIRAAFTPPLGLSQSQFDIIVFVFASVMVVVIATLLWAGFLAKTKSAKAATLVEHFGTFLLGAFFGTKL
jgi:hypothetical protein